LKDNKKALDDYNAAVANAADSFGADVYLQHRALFFNSIGQYQKSINDCTAAIKLAPANFANYTSRALSYEKLGKIDLAEKDKLKAKELGYAAPNQPTASVLVHQHR